MGSVRTPQIRAALVEPLRCALANDALVLSETNGEWPRLDASDVRTLLDHGIAPLVYRATKLPALRAAAIHAAAHETLRESDLRQVLELLTARGIAPLLIKGSALAYSIYDAPELRPRGDTDLLIRSEEASGARDAMRAAGFTEQVTSGDEHGVRQMFFTRQGAMGVRHSYDIHWSLTNSAIFSSAFESERIRERSVAIPALGPHARTLAPVDALLLACIHRVAHHQDSDRLIWLADIVKLLDNMSSAELATFWRLAAAGRTVGVCARSIDLACHWFLRRPVPGPAAWLTEEELSRDEPSRQLLNRSISYGSVIAANLRALPWPARVVRLRQLAFPPAAYMTQTYGVHSPVIRPVLYLRRAVSGIRRLFRRRADL
ncbi:MAG TPA: nucleotidyltransferase family protein [Thermoanaerobaculia bacterium]